MGNNGFFRDSVEKPGGPNILHYLSKWMSGGAKVIDFGQKATTRPRDQQPLSTNYSFRGNLIQNSTTGDVAYTGDPPPPRHEDRQASAPDSSYFVGNAIANSKTGDVSYVSSATWQSEVRALIGLFDQLQFDGRSQELIGATAPQVDWLRNVAIEGRADHRSVRKVLGDISSAVCVSAAGSIAAKQILDLVSKAIASL